MAKDVRALASVAREFNIEPRILEAVDHVNERQKLVIQTKIEQHFDGDLAGKTIAVWGLAFKPQTDDIREAPALTLIDSLLGYGVKLQVHDPEAMENVRAKYGDRLHYAALPMEALEGADALAIMTEWSEFRHPDFEKMREVMRTPVVFDGRNLYDCHDMHKLGFAYHSIGRTPVSPPGMYR